MQRAGKRVPALDNRPDIVGLSWDWQAFWELSTCRSLGALMGPIPWTAIHVYAQAQGLNTDEAQLLHEAVRHMDTVWLNYHTEAAKVKTKSQPTKTRRTSRGRRR